MWVHYGSGRRIQLLKHYNKRDERLLNTLMCEKMLDNSILDRVVEWARGL